MYIQAKVLRFILEEPESQPRLPLFWVRWWWLYFRRIAWRRCAWIGERRGKAQRALVQVNCSCWGESGSDHLWWIRKNGLVSDLPGGHCLWDQLPGGTPLDSAAAKREVEPWAEPGAREGFLLWTNAHCTFGYVLSVQFCSPSGEASGSLKTYVFNWG